MISSLSSKYECLYFFIFLLDMSSMGDTNNPSTGSPLTAATGFTATTETNVQKEKSSVWNHFTKLNFSLVIRYTK